MFFNKLMKFLLVTAFIGLSACVLSDQPLLDDANSDTPFPASFTATMYDPDKKQDQTVSFVQDGRAYINGSEQPSTRALDFRFRFYRDNIYLVQITHYLNPNQIGRIGYQYAVHLKDNEYAYALINACDNLSPGNYSGFSVTAGENGDKESDCHIASLAALEALVDKDIAGNGLPTEHVVHVNPTTPSAPTQPSAPEASNNQPAPQEQAPQQSAAYPPPTANEMFAALAASRMDNYKFRKVSCANQPDENGYQCKYIVHEAVTAMTGLMGGDETYTAHFFILNGQWYARQVE